VTALNLDIGDRMWWPHPLSRTGIDEEVPTAEQEIVVA